MKKHMKFAAVACALLSTAACTSYPQSVAVKMISEPSKYNVGKNVIPSQIYETDTEVVIVEGEGGWVNTWENLGWYILGAKKRLHIMNGCWSGCTLTADIVRRNDGDVCVLDRTVFGYHNASHGKGVYSDISRQYSIEISQWVADNGGWLNSHNMTLQSGAHLHKFYKVCEVK